MKSKIRVFAPATVANLGCGFDAMGLAIDSPGDELQLSLNKENKLRIIKISGDGNKLSYDPEKNTAAVAIQALLDSLNSKQGFDIFMKKKMPLGSGLGSSAASSAAGAFAANELLGKPFMKAELVKFAMEGERIASGTAHADNVAPSMLGGIVLIRSYSPLEIISLNVPAKLHIVVIHPDIQVLTKNARQILPKKISMRDGISQWSNTAAFVSALYSSDIDLLGKATEDKIAEPYRYKLIPYYENVKAAALDSGASGCNISGSGPSMFALTDSMVNAKRIAASMRKEFSRGKISSTAFISKVNAKGARII